MRLYTSAASPFARKCRIVAHERGLLGRLEQIVVDPYGEDPRLLAANPIAQIPALELDDGTFFFNSPVICAYLDGLDGTPRLTPSQGTPAYWRARRIEALADGALEMAVKLTLEARRPQAERSASWIERWTRGLVRTLDAAENETPAPTPFDLGTVALGCVGAYLDLRQPGLNWREGRPRLAAFSAEVERRESFRATAPA